MDLKRRANVFKRKNWLAYLIKPVGETLYYCFHDSDPRAIRRLDHDEDGNVRIMWAYGNWQAAEELDCIPTNETMNKPNKEN